MDRKIRVLIMGAAGRDFHNFNTYFRDNKHNAEIYEVVAFTAEQIPDIAGRIYPPELAGSLYPNGIPIHPEEELSKLIEDLDVDLCVLAYSDLHTQTVLDKASIVNACGPDFMLIGPKKTMIKSSKPVISICAVRTGCGKSQTSRRVITLLKELGLKIVTIRHPMPYGNLVEQIWQRYATLEDLKKYKCTIEEMEEYEPHIKIGSIIYAGVDYGKILEKAEEEAQVVVWDGGNNDFPFYASDLEIVIADPHRLGNESSYYPGQINSRRADVLIINKADSAPEGSVDKLKANLLELNPDATIIIADSTVSVDSPELVKNKKVLVVEDGPTVSHGDMSTGAGTIAAKRFGAKEIIDPEPFAVGSIKATYDKYPHLKGSGILPAMGYGNDQRAELEETINKSDADVVIIGTPIDLSRVINIKKPYTRVTYELEEISKPDLEEILKKFVTEHGLK